MDRAGAAKCWKLCFETVPFPDSRGWYKIRVVYSHHCMLPALSQCGKDLPTIQSGCHQMHIYVFHVDYYALSPLSLCTKNRIYV